MPKGRITDTAVGALRSKSPGAEFRGGANTFRWDTALEGFGVAVFPSGKKSFVVQYRQNGRSRRITLGKVGVLSASDAREQAKIILGKVAKGEDPIAARRAGRDVRTFKTLADDFMTTHAAKKLKESTREGYEVALSKYILPAIGSRRVIDPLLHRDVARLHDGLSNTPSMANRCLAVISAIWNWAAKPGRREVAADANPAKGIDRNDEEQKERFLSANEMARLGDVMRRAETEGLPWTADETKPNAKHTPKGPKVRLIDVHAVAAIRLLMLTGARLREILNAQWSYIDWERGIMFLPDSKTGKKTIYLSAAALAVLKEIPRIEGNFYIVPGESRKGEPIPRADLKRPWRAIARAAGLADVRLHDLRHSFASTGAGASLGLQIVGKLLGHSQPATTARYSHLDADPMHRAADIIGNQISAMMAGKTADIVPLRAKK